MTARTCYEMASCGNAKQAAPAAQLCPRGAKASSIDRGHVEDRAAAKGWAYLQTSLPLLTEWGFIHQCHIPTARHLHLGQLLRERFSSSHQFLPAGQGFSKMGVLSSFPQALNHQKRLTAVKWAKFGQTAPRCGNNTHR